VVGQAEKLKGLETATAPKTVMMVRATITDVLNLPSNPNPPPINPAIGANSANERNAALALPAFVSLSASSTRRLTTSRVDDIFDSAILV
jgi:hypothetical protein